MFTYFAYLAHDADGTLILGVVLGTIERTLFVRCAAVDGSVTSGADVEFGELIILDLHCIMRVAFALGFHFLGLWTLTLDGGDRKPCEKIT